MKALMLALMLSVAFTPLNCASADASVLLNSDGHYVVQVTVHGPRGSLTFPAMIDTGASISIIPNSIAEGIGIASKSRESFVTAGGRKELDVIQLERLSFCGIEFTNLEVAVSKSDTPMTNQRLNIYDFNSSSSKPKENPLPTYVKELAVIGMAELSKTNFCCILGVLKFEVE